MGGAAYVRSSAGPEGISCCSDMVIVGIDAILCVSLSVAVDCTEREGEREGCTHTTNKLVVSGPQIYTLKRGRVWQ